MTAEEVRNKLEENRYKDKPFMTEEEFIKKLQDDGYTGEFLELAIQTYQKGKEKGYDFTVCYDVFYGQTTKFSD